MSTPHNNAEKGEIAKSVLLPGDPLRAKFIAEHYLSGAKCFNEVRGALGYTGTYKGVPVSVMGTGMGCASMGIYSYELIHHYGCTSLIRIGSCGAFTEKLNLGDLVMAIGASSDTNYAGQYRLGGGNFSATASFRLLSKAVSEAEKQKAPFMVGNVYCTDVFYRPQRIPDVWKNMGILAAEMESFALYCNAAVAGVDALTILTVSDQLVTGRSMTSEEREKSFNDMMVVALETAAAQSG
ncbi:MAG: purine-nucleoside phosphorylase [Spirochaetaceae bacterium]|jgi:purine-nucleoside phosphorylase|nr:purine-nucleoside phosphorylase [Spirochaetaceae bacterium]